MAAVFVFQGDAWIKLFNQSSSNTNVSACKTLNLKTYLMVNKHSHKMFNHVKLVGQWSEPTIYASVLLVRDPM